MRWTSALLQRAGAARCFYQRAGPARCNSALVQRAGKNSARCFYQRAVSNSALVKEDKFICISNSAHSQCKTEMADVGVVVDTDDEDVEIMLLMAVAASAAVYSQQQCNKRRRLHWVHPVNEKRDVLGEYATLVPELRCDSQLFHRYFRMSTVQFDELLGLN